MHFLDGSVSSFFQAQLAQRVCGYVSLAYLLPAETVCSVDVRITLIFIVLSARGFPVFVTILFIGKVRTAGKATRLFRSMRHTLTSFRAYENSPLGLNREGCLFIRFA